MPLKVSVEQQGLLESINRVVNGVNRKGLNVKIRASEYTAPLGRITASANEFTKSLEASNARVLAFGASAAIIGGVTLAMKEIVVQAVKFEKIMTDINVVLGTSTSNLEKFGRELYNVARNTSQGLNIAAEAALEFSRQGLSMEETLKRTNDALILTRLTGIQAADAVSGLTAAVNGFADAGLTTTSIINKLAAVDVQFAVSAEDLINALARSGAVAQDAGVSFDQLVGAVTSAQQITARGGAVIGNSFKTIFTRVQRSSTLDRLEELGIAVRDIRGSTLPAITVLTNLSKTYDTLGDSTKAAVAEQVGGVFQINVLKAALKDLNRENSLYARATEISSQATDQAQQKNAMLQKTISSLSAQTLLSVQELAKNVGDIALSPGISKVLNAVNSFAQTINDVLGGGEDKGSEFAKGIVRGVGNVLMGPGLVLAFGIFTKLFVNALKFGKDSLKDVLGIVTAKDKERAIQQSIVSAMEQNKNLSTELFRLAGNTAAQEELMLATIKQQTKFLEKQQKIAATLAPMLRGQGVTQSLTLPTRGKGGKSQNYAGFIPNFSKPTTQETVSEVVGAYNSGYTPGNVKPMNIKGIGRVVYNDAEAVKKFPGMAQPAIIPPKTSDAGRKYKSEFEKKLGFDPYAFGGFVPNFADPRSRAQKIRDVLSDPANKGIKFKPGAMRDFPIKSENDFRFIEIFLKSKTGDGSLYLDRLRKVRKYTPQQIEQLKELRRQYQSGGRVSLSGREIFNSGFIPNFAQSFTGLNSADLGQRAQVVGNTNIMQLPPAKMLTETNVMKGTGMKGKKMTGWHMMEAPLISVMKNIITYKQELMALQDLGIDVLRRQLFFTNLEQPGDKKGAVSAAAKVARKGGTTKQFGDKYESVLHSRYLKGAGYLRTHDQAKVDFIGGGKMPIEGKYNKVAAANLIAKSIRLYGDKAIVQFLQTQGQRGIASSLKNKNFQDSLNVLEGAGINTKGLSLKEQVKLVKDHQLHDGFVPNFSAAANLALAGGLVKKNKFGNVDRRQLSSLINSHPHFGSLMKTHLTWNSFPPNEKGKLHRWLLTQGISRRALQAYGFTSANSANIAGGMANMIASGGFIPNFSPGSQFIKPGPKGLNLNKNRSVNATVAYLLSGNKAFKPHKGQILPTNPTAKTMVKGQIAELNDLGRINWQVGVKSGSASYEKLLKAPHAKPGIAIAFNTQPGHDYEKIIADRYLNSGWTGKSPDRLDYRNAVWNMQTRKGKLATPIKRNSANAFSQLWQYGDAHSGEGHIKRDVIAKLASAGLINPGQIISSSNTGKTIDLSHLNFAEIAKFGRDGPIDTSKVYRANNGIFGTILQGQKGKAGDKPFAFRFNQDRFSNVHNGFIPNFSKRVEGAETSNTQVRSFNLKQERHRPIVESFLLGKITPAQLYGHGYNKKDIKSLNQMKDYLNVGSGKTVTINDVPFFKPLGGTNKEALTSHVPNFVNPLAAAFAREKAAGVPDSQIRIDQDNSLKSRANPAGLAVINTRDEPMGVKQGIQRAVNMGMDPKTHGASGGFVPNFSAIDSGYLQRIDQSAQKASNSLNKTADSASKAAISNNASAQSASKAASSNNASAQSGMGLMGAMFALSTATYALDGIVGEAETSMAKFSKVTISGIQGLANSAMIFSGLNEVGKSMQSSGGLMGALGKATRGLGGVAAGAALLIPLFTSIRENYDLTAMDSLNRSAKKVSKTLDGLSTSISTSQELESAKNELTELNNSSLSGTLEGRKKSMDIQTKITQKQSELSGTINLFSSELGLSGEQVQSMASGTATGMRELQKAQLLYAKKLNAINIGKNLIESRTTEDRGFWDMAGDFFKAGNPFAFFTDEAARARRAFEEDIGFADRSDASSKIDKDKLRAAQITAAASLGTTLESNEAASEILNVGVTEGTDDYIKKLTENINTAFKTGDIDKISAATEIQEMLLSFKDKEEFLRREGIVNLRNINILLDKYRGGLVKDEKNREKAQAATVRISELRKELQMRIAEQAQAAKDQAEIIKAQQGLAETTTKYQTDFKNAIGIQTKAAQVLATITAQRVAQENQNQNELQKIEDERIASIKSLVEKNLTSSKLGKGLSFEEVEENKELTVGQKTQQFETKRSNVVDVAKGISGADSDVVAQLTSETVTSFEQIRLILAEWIGNLSKTGKSQIAINELQDRDILNGNDELSKLIANQNSKSKSSVDKQGKLNDLKNKEIDVNEQSLNLQSGTVSSLKAQLNKIQNMNNVFDGIYSLDRIDIERELMEASKLQADIKYEELKVAQSYKESGQGLIELREEQLSLERNRVTIEYDSVFTTGQRLEAEEKLRKSMDEYQNIIAQKVKNEIKTMGFSAEDDTALLEEQRKQKYFAVEAETNYTKTVNEGTRAQERFSEALRTGQFELEAMQGMAEDSRNFRKAMIQATTKLNEGGFFQEGQRNVQNKSIGLESQLQTKQGEASVYAGRGSGVRLAETQLEMAKVQKELNLEYGDGRMFADSMKIKLGELNVELKRFNETLANTTFDAVRDGMRTFVKDIVSGTQSAGDAALSFISKIAGAIHEKLLENAADRITSGIMTLTSPLWDGETRNNGGLIGYASGGSVGRYASGGSVNKVPAMLTAGEYVVKKKIVDRIGTKNLESINESGSLEDLYNKPNEDVFDITTEDAAPIPPIARLNEGGNLAAFLKQRNLGIGRVSENERSTVNGEIVNDFTNTLDSLFQKQNFGNEESNKNISNNNSNSKTINNIKNSNAINNMGGPSDNLKYFNKGGLAIDTPNLNFLNKGGQPTTTITKKDQAYMDIAGGAGYTLGSYWASDKDDQNVPEPPEPPKYQKINTSSKLSLNDGFTDRDMMSQRFKAEDQFTKDMKKFHLDMYQYQVDRRNEKVQKRANLIQDIAGSAAMIGGRMLGNKIADKMLSKPPSVEQLGKEMTNIEMNQAIREGKGSEFIANRQAEVDGRSIVGDSNTISSITNKTSSLDLSSTFNSAAGNKLDSINIGQDTPAGIRFNRSLGGNESIAAPDSMLQSLFPETESSKITSTFKTAQDRITSGFESRAAVVAADNLSLEFLRSNPTSSNNSYSPPGTAARQWLEMYEAIDTKNAGGIVNKIQNRNQGGLISYHNITKKNNGGIIGGSSSAVYNNALNKNIQNSMDQVNNQLYSNIAKNTSNQMTDASNMFSQSVGDTISSAYSNIVKKNVGGIIGPSNIMSSQRTMNLFGGQSQQNFSNNIFSNPRSNTNIASPYSYSNQGGFNQVTHSNVYGSNYFSRPQERNYNSQFSYFSGGGKVRGPGGIDKVGPVMLDRGEYVIKASSVNNVEKQYPGFFDRLNSMKMNQGGPVADVKPITPNSNNSTTTNENSNSSSVVVNINVSSDGATSVDGGSADQKQFAAKIKDAVIGIISQEKRVGGMLRG